VPGNYFSPLLATTQNSIHDIALVKKTGAVDLFDTLFFAFSVDISFHLYYSSLGVGKIEKNEAKNLY
jgi:hypothetical protein